MKTRSHKSTKYFQIHMRSHGISSSYESANMYPFECKCFFQKWFCLHWETIFSRLRSKQNINSYYKSLHIQLLVTSFTAQQLCDENSCQNYFSGIYRRFFLWKEVLGTILDPLHTEHKLNVYKKSGQRPRRLLNILCRSMFRYGC